MGRTRAALMFAFLLAARFPAAAPAEDAPKALVRVVGEVPKAVELTAESLSKLPRQTVRVTVPGGKEVAYEGVPLVELLKAAGVKFGHDLRGKALADYLVVEAADGYRVVFALPELDPDSTDRVILLADRRDGQPIDAKEGPLRVVVPGEKKHARWVRQVVALRVGRG